MNFTRYINSYIYYYYHVKCCLLCKLNMSCTFYVFMFYQCCILCPSERKYILDIQRIINKIIIIKFWKIILILFVYYIGVVIHVMRDVVRCGQCSVDWSV